MDWELDLEREALGAHRCGCFYFGWLARPSCASPKSIYLCEPQDPQFRFVPEHDPLDPNQDPASTGTEIHPSRPRAAFDLLTRLKELHSIVTEACCIASFHAAPEQEHWVETCRSD